MNNLINTFYNAKNTPAWLEGLGWYTFAGHDCTRLNRFYKLTPYKMSGLMSCANINASWQGTYKNVGNLIKGRGLPIAVKKAKLLLAGAQYDTVFAPLSKSWCFANNIYGNLNWVTVDRHIFRCARLTNTPKHREAIQNTVTQLARIANIFPAQAQAIIWCASK